METSKFPEHLTGLRPAWPDAWQKAQHMTFTFTTECLAGDRSPFGRMMRSGVLLCDETRDALYSSRHGFKRVPYRAGSHPMLENYVRSIVGEHPEPTGETVARLSHSLGDLPEKFGTPPAFLYGESDEQTILKGGGHCSCKSRLLVALCQTLGIEARPVMTWARPHPGTNKLVAGHTVVEARLEGRWSFFDPQRRLYAFADNRYWSIGEIHDDVRALSRTPAKLLEEMKPNLSAGPLGEGFEAYHRAMFGREAMITVGEYDLDDPAIVVRWNWADATFRQKQHRDSAVNLAKTRELAAAGKLTDDIYRLGLRDFRERFHLPGELPSLAI